MKRGAVIASALVATTVWAATPVRTTGFGQRGGALVISVGVQDLFQAPDLERLTSGFATRVLVHVALVREGNNQAVAEATRWSEIVYDLWDERFHVRRTDGAAVPEVRDAATAQEALTLATALVAFPVAPLPGLQAGAVYRVNVRADLNPLSEELVGRVRRWLARPAGRTPDGVFGSFVSFFVNPKVQDSERRVQFVSQPVVVR